jgi:hypothetical protein
MSAYFLGTKDRKDRKVRVYSTFSFFISFFKNKNKNKISEIEGGYPVFPSFLQTFGYIERHSL